MRPTRLMLLLPLILAACDGSSARETLGLTRDAPDEFTVVSRPALSVPPDFELRPPRPGEEPRGVNAVDSARAALLGAAAKPSANPQSLELPKTETAVVPVMAKDTPTDAQAKFWKQIGADKAQDDIRNVLGDDDAQSKEKKPAKSLLDQLAPVDNSESVVDPKKEAERLRQNKDAGKPATEGDVPVEEVKPPSVLDRIF